MKCVWYISSARSSILTAAGAELTGESAAPECTVEGQLLENCCLHRQLVWTNGRLCWPLGAIRYAHIPELLHDPRLQSLNWRRSCWKTSTASEMKHFIHSDAEETDLAAKGRSQLLESGGASLFRSVWFGCFCLLLKLVWWCETSKCDNNIINPYFTFAD